MAGTGRDEMARLRSLLLRLFAPGNAAGALDIEQLRKQARRAARKASGATREITLGMYEGLTASGHAHLRPRSGEEEKHHAGYLAGHLISWIAANHSIDRDMVMVTATYGAALATPEGQRAVPEAAGNRLAPSPGQPSAIKSHIFAAVLAEKKSGRRLEVAVEQLCFEWLLEQSRTRLTPEIVAKQKQMRERRLQRTGM
jgi:hypothetical protein